MKILRTLSTWISDKWTRKNKHPSIEVGDYWKRPENVYPIRVDGVTSVWGRVVYVSLEPLVGVWTYKEFITRYEFYKKNSDKVRRVINTGETQSTTIRTFSGMPSVLTAALKIIEPYILMVAVFVSAAVFILALPALRTWMNS